MFQRQALALANNLALKGAALQWIKPVADELRKRDESNGTDSLAAALVAMMGGGAVLRSISALTGRSGSNTVRLKRSADGQKIGSADVNNFLKSLPSADKSKSNLVRAFARVKGSTEVLADVPETLVGDLLACAKEAGYQASILEGTVPEAESESVPGSRDDRFGGGGYQRRSEGYGGYRRSEGFSRGRDGDSYEKNYDRRGSDRTGGERSGGSRTGSWGGDRNRGSASTYRKRSNDY